jgi:hypothetical protein
MLWGCMCHRGFYVTVISGNMNSDKYMATLGTIFFLRPLNGIPAEIGYSSKIMLGATQVMQQQNICISTTLMF